MEEREESDGQRAQPHRDKRCKVPLVDPEHETFVQQSENGTDMDWTPNEKKRKSNESKDDAPAIEIQPEAGPSKSGVFTITLHWQ